MNLLEPSLHFDLSPFGSENVLIGDINNDGRAEFVFTQGPGSLGIEAYRPGKAVGWRRNHVTEEDLALDCLTAMDLTGRLLWQTGQPWQRPYPFRTHGGANGMLIGDMDGDGTRALWRIHGDRLEMIEGLTGRVSRAVTLDSDGYYKLLTARFSGGKRKQLLVKPLGSGLEGHPHGCPVTVYDAELAVFWPPRDYPGVGHHAVPWDVDGDGRDEALLGWSLVGPDGNIRWTLPLEGNADTGHPDRQVVADIDGDGELEQVLALEQLGLVASDLAGRIKWRRPSGHCGDACVGKFFGDRPGLQILTNDEVAGQKRRNGSLVMVDGRDGTAIWEHTEDHYGVPVAWPTAYGPQAILATRHEYYDDPEDARPFVMDGRRNVLARFALPQRLPSYKDYALPHDHKWRGDWGDYYVYQLVDLDGTGPRLVVSTRMDLWAFELTSKR
ncbi:MAG: hypothetical protein HY343_06200 [Lentisphaerae bacterium]|nr:hypothetical protein [Lentisphaerota bacterium]